MSLICGEKVKKTKKPSRFQVLAKTRTLLRNRRLALYCTALPINRSPKTHHASGLFSLLPFLLAAHPQKQNISFISQALISNSWVIRLLFLSQLLLEDATDEKTRPSLRVFSKGKGEKIQNNWKGLKKKKKQQQQHFECLMRVVKNRLFKMQSDCEKIFISFREMFWI